MGDNGKHTPFGIVDENTGQLFIHFGSSAKTSDFIVDSLEDWWTMLPELERQATHRIQIKVDNGPESSVSTLNSMAKPRSIQLGQRFLSY